MRSIPGYFDIIFMLIKSEHIINDSKSNNGLKCLKQPEFTVLISKVLLWIIAIACFTDIYPEGKRLQLFWVCFIIVNIINLTVVIPIYAWYLHKSYIWIKINTDHKNSECKHVPKLKLNLEWVCLKCGSKLYSKSIGSKIMDKCLQLIDMSMALALIDYFKPKNWVYLMICIIIPTMIWWAIGYLIKKFVLINRDFDTE